MCLVAPQTAGAAVFGRDDRVRLPAERTDLGQTVGALIDVRRKTVCTAFCVAPTVIATAAHCLFPPGGGAMSRPDDIRFRMRLSQSRGEARLAGHGAGSASESVLAGKRQLSLTPPIDAADDWALLRLDRPACAAGGLAISRRSPAEVRAAAQRGLVYQVAIHRDFEGFAPALGAPCRLHPESGTQGEATRAADFESPERILLHACDTGGSSSGSPLLIDGPDGTEVVAINVGTYLSTSAAAPTGDTAAHALGAAGTREIANTAIAAGGLAPLVAALSEGRRPARPHRIAEVQTWLADLKLYAGPRDGRFNALLAVAVLRYEAVRGLPRTGLPSDELWQRLKREAAR